MEAEERSAPVEPRQWEVVGGAEKGGVLVKEGKDASSKQLPQRLTTGSVIEELDLVGERLHFRLLTGNGPPEGWISTVISKKVMARPVGASPDDPIPRGETAPAPRSAAGESGAEAGGDAFHRQAGGAATAGRGQDLQDSCTVPSMHELLSSIDRDERRDEEVPSIEEVLAAIERDAKEEGDFEEAADSRRMFFELGNSMQLANLGPVQPPTREELEVQSDIATHLGKFSYDSMKALGAAILAEARRPEDSGTAGSAA
mmetsp:Transcript_1830/g.5770  ORF Transcript_1830/g.5770 Transcript_1830/m.5770 type:complete len:258 (+) Transcript_1830:142-915(+)